MNRTFYQKHLQIGRSFFASHGTHAMNYFASLGIFMRQLTQDAEVTKSLHDMLLRVKEAKQMRVKTDIHHTKILIIPR